MKRKPRPSASDVLAVTGFNRRNNLRRLIGARFETQADLASALAVTDSYLTQLIGRKPTRRVTETTARKFEYKLDLATGALDKAAG